LINWKLRWLKTLTGGRFNRCQLSGPGPGRDIFLQPPPSVCIIIIYSRQKKTAPRGRGDAEMRMHVSRGAVGYTWWSK